MSDIKAGFVWSDKAENFANNKAMALRLNKTIGEATVNLNEVLPDQTGQAGKFLKTDGTDVLWDTASGGGTGPAGLDGSYPAFIYRNATTQPPTPTGGSYDGTTFTPPAGWTHFPVDPATGLLRWVSLVYFADNGTAWAPTGAWSTPAKDFETLGTTGVSAGSYGTASQVGSFTVDTEGRLTAASNTPIAIANTAVSGLGNSSTRDVGTTAGTVAAGDDPRFTAASVLEWINVKDYGAVGDGVTNDDNAINAAFAAIPAVGPVQHIVVTNQGSGYTSDPTITISGGGGSGASAQAVIESGELKAINVNLGGSGYTSVPTVTISGGGGTGAVAFAVYGTPTTVYFPPGRYRMVNSKAEIWQHSMVTVLGKQATLYCEAQGQINLFYGPDSHFSVVKGLTFEQKMNLYFNPRDIGAGIKVQGYHHDFIDCRFYNCQQFGLHLGENSAGLGSTEGAYFVKVTNCMFEKNGGDGLHITNAQDVVVTGCMFQETGDDGIGIINDGVDPIYKPKRIVISGCLIVDAWSMGIRIESADDVSIYSTSILGSGESAISVGSTNKPAAPISKGIVIDGLTIREPGRTRPGSTVHRGIRVQNDPGIVQGLMITNCTFQNVQGGADECIYLKAEPNPPNTGTGGVLTANVTNGVITSVTVNNGGTGYVTGAEVLFNTYNTTGIGAVATLVVDGNGTITSVTVLEGGRSYNAATVQCIPDGQPGKLYDVMVANNTFVNCSTTSGRVFFTENTLVNAVIGNNTSLQPSNYFDNGGGVNLTFFNNR